MPMFVDTSPPGQCIFCKLVAGEIPAATIYEDALTMLEAGANRLGASAGVKIIAGPTGEAPSMGY